MRVQAGGEEPIRSRGYSQPAAEGDELRGRAATHHERLQVCEDMLEIEDTTFNIGSCIPKALYSLCFFFLQVAFTARNGALFLCTSRERNV